MSIHPTAVIAPEAQLAEDVKVGAYAVIEGSAKIGAGCEIQAHAVLTGDVVLGERNLVGHGAVIGGFPQDLAFDRATPSGVVIGSDNVIREHVTIHRGTAAESVTRVGDKNFLMAGAHLGHNVEIGNRCIIANATLLGGHVHIADGVFIGGGCVFHQFVHVGELVIAQGLSAFSKNIPPYTLAAERNGVGGLNVVGLRRAGLGADERAEIKRAFRLLYSSGHNVAQALAAAQEIEWRSHGKRFFEFVESSRKRGVCDLIAGRGKAAAAPPESA